MVWRNASSDSEDAEKGDSQYSCMTVAAGSSHQGRVRHRDNVVSNAQRKDQRGRQKKLVAALDAVIPVQAKRRASWNGAGANAAPDDAVRCGLGPHPLLDAPFASMALACPPCTLA